MNPETRFTNRFRKKMRELIFCVQIYKHSDRFNSGISDLHFTMPRGKLGWVEVKYMPKCVTRRKAGVTELQEAYLQEHWTNGIPAFVLVGVGKLSTLYPISQFDGYVYGEDLVTDEVSIAKLQTLMEGSHE